MPRLFLPTVFAALLFGLLARSLHPQSLPAPTSDDQLGMQPYQSYHGGDIDLVSLSSGIVNIDVPVLVYPQRGKLHLSFNLLAGSSRGARPAWTCFPAPPPAHQTCTWIWPTGQGSSPVNVVYFQPPQVTAISVTNVINENTPNPTYLHYGNWSLVMPDGSKHPLGNLGTLTFTCTAPDCWYTASGPFEALDATGWRVNGTLVGQGQGAPPLYPPPNSSVPTSIVGPDGVIYRSSNALEEDPNGNTIALNSSVVTDSLGRQVSLPPTSASSSNVSTSGCPQPPQVLLPVDHAVAWSVPGLSGGTATYTFCYAVVSLNIPPGVFGNNSPAHTSTSMDLQSIVLPNGQAWNFEYNDPGDGSTYNGSPVNYGTLTQLGLPTGGTISYTYAMNGSNVFCQDNGRWITSRIVNANDGTGSHTWTYAYTLQNGVSASTTVTDPLGNYTVHTFGLITGCSGYETQAEYFQNGGTLLKTVNTTFTSSSSRNVSSGLTNIVPVQTTTVWPNGKTSQITKAYDSYTYTDFLGSTGQTASYGKVLSESAYDYGNNAAGPLLRTTKTNYLALSNSSYLTNNLLNLPSSVQVLNSSGTQVAYSTYGYDEYQPLNSSGVTTQHDSAPPDGTYRGNQTSVHRWLNGSTASPAPANCQTSVSNGYLISYATFNDTGTVNTSVDSCGSSATDATHMTTFAYSSNYVGAFPTSITNPKGQITSHTYDLNTGLLMSTTDPNTQTTNFTYDSLWRLASASYPDGGSSTITRQETTFPFSATLTKKITSSQNYVTTNVFDGLGRVSQSQLTDPQGTVYTAATYDALGRKYQEYNPTRCNPPTTNCGESTWGVTSYTYDPLNRTTLVTKPDGNTVQTAYCAGTTLVTDEAGRWRRSTTDGLGRLIEVDEPNSATATVNVCPGSGEPIWVTTYAYDALDDLISVVQSGSHNRTFLYDSLKHLTSSTNPEAGTVTYAYDADSNVITKADARSITITYSYDTLNRMTGRSYSNGDPSVSYAYDQTTCIGQSPCYNVGRRTSVIDAGGSESLSYDQMGREWGEQRTTNSVTKTTSYAYNYDGSLKTLAYPSGRVITYTTDSAGRPSEAVDTANSINYATGTCANGVNTTGTCYAPQGAVSSLALGQVGSFAGIILANTYNSRLQPSELKASSSAGTAMDLTYSFVDANSHNSGNVIGITNNKDTTRSQSFTYDQVNRLITADTSATTGSNCWGETYTYDQWANMTSIGALSGYTGCTQESGLSVTALTNNQLSATGFAYDAAGNMTGDGAYTYGFNAESEIKSAAGVNYTYDGDGNRVQKSNGKIYWYGAGTEILDESDSSGNITDEYVFFGGKRTAHRVVSSGSISYYAEDFLGSSRVITTSTGSVCYEADFYPYGGERVLTNTCGQNYKFEGKERDTETSNDDFGARYYSSRLGRWLSADWSSVPAPVPYANLTNPQTLNLYAMVHDNPETFADLDGHQDDPGGSGSSTSSSSSTSSTQSGTPPPPQANPQGVTSGTSQSQSPQPSGQKTTMSADPNTPNTHEPTIRDNPNYFDSRQATCIGEGIKAGTSEMVPFNDEIKATANAIADGSLKPLKDLVSAGSAVEAASHGAEKVKDTRSVQKAVKAFLKSQGVKTSANAVQRTASLATKAFAALSAVLALNTGYEEYQACMAR